MVGCFLLNPLRGKGNGQIKGKRHVIKRVGSTQLKNAVFMDLKLIKITEHLKKDNMVLERANRCAVSLKS